MQKQRLIIEGGHKLSGEITVQGAKNSSLPILAGTILTDEEIILKNCPRLTDIFAGCRILNHMGGSCGIDGNVIRVKNDGISRFEIPDEMMREMRSSIIFLGAILGRYGKCKLSFPGGCELGPRPIDMHLAALRKMGAVIKEEYGIIDCEAPKGLKGEKIQLSFPSVGATENIMLSAVLAKGDTEIRNSAREPEIKDLANFLNACGADIRNAGESTIYIRGVEKLHGCEYEIMPDRIVTATYISAVAGAGGELKIAGADISDLYSGASVFEQAGCYIYPYKNGIYVSAVKPLKAVPNIRTMPYPAFPTDAQAIVMSALCKAEGISVFEENIFENRYRHVDSLIKMGGNIKVFGKVAIVEGVKKLYGAKVSATDLRGGASLVVAGVMADGITEIDNIGYIDRGYEEIERAFSSIGAKIKRV